MLGNRESHGICWCSKWNSLNLPLTQWFWGVSRDGRGHIGGWISTYLSHESTRIMESFSINLDSSTFYVWLASPSFVKCVSPSFGGHWWQIPPFLFLTCFLYKKTDASSPLADGTCSRTPVSNQKEAAASTKSSKPQPGSRWDQLVAGRPTSNHSFSPTKKRWFSGSEMHEPRDILGQLEWRRGKL